MVFAGAYPLQFSFFLYFLILRLPWGHEHDLYVLIDIWDDEMTSLLLFDIIPFKMNILSFFWSIHTLPEFAYLPILIKSFFIRNRTQQRRMVANILELKFSGLLTDWLRQFVWNQFFQIGWIFNRIKSSLVNSTQIELSQRNSTLCDWGFSHFVPN